MTISRRFTGRVTFDGHIGLERLDREKKPARAKEVLAAWWREHRMELSKLKARYEDVKEVGRRSLAAKPEINSPLVPGTSTARSTTRSAEALLDDRTGESPRVGRNDPCPCGSGKKYKKCCIRKSAST